jgi:hypothetical protein
VSERSGGPRWALVSCLPILLSLSATVSALGGNGATDRSRSEAAEAELQSLDPQTRAATALLMETKRLKECTDGAMQTRGLDEPAVLAMLDRDPEAPALRNNLLRLIRQDTPLDADEQRLLDAKTSVGDLVVTYMLRSAASFDLPVLARASGIQAVYLDRALGGGCKPSQELLDFIGAERRAD